MRTPAANEVAVAVDVDVDVDVDADADLDLEALASDYNVLDDEEAPAEDAGCIKVAARASEDVVETKKSGHRLGETVSVKDSNPTIVVDVKGTDTDKVGLKRPENLTENPETAADSTSDSEIMMLGGAIDATTTLNTDASMGHESIPMALPRLARNFMARPPARPGAHAAEPGNHGSLLVPVPFSILQRNRPSRTLERLRTPAEGTPNQDAVGLSEAIPVDEDAERGLQEATPHDPSQNRSKIKTTSRSLCLMLVLLLAVLAVVVSVVLSSHKKDASPATNPKAPTSSPTSAPTLAPTLSPTSLIDEGYLPNSTMMAIMDPLSPQDLAYQWLAGHPWIRTIPEWRKVQLFALATFYYSFRGDDWAQVVKDDFLQYNKSECYWYSNLFAANTYDINDFYVTGRDMGPSCNEENGQFQILSLSFRKKTAPAPTELPAVLPAEMALLEALVELRLYGIAFNGPLSSFFIPELKQMRNLTKIDLSNNNFQGPITSEHIHVLPPAIEELKIGKTPGISGTIPTEIGLVSTLKHLQIYSTGINGTIPTELGSLTSLETLDLGHSGLTGTIPTVLCSLPNFTELELIFTELTGSLPSNIEECSNLALLQVYAHLTGTLPQTLPTSLEYFFLQGNMLSGTIPSFDKLPNLTSLLLVDNQLSGSIPTNLVDTNALFVYIAENSLTGPIPDRIWANSDMISLRFNDNVGLWGQIPAAQLSSFHQLGYFELDGNSFSGKVPLEAFRNSSDSLVALHLGRNQFSGTIASEVGLLSNMQFLTLDHNQMTGTIPEEIGNCSSLRNLQLQQNNFSGTIPTGLGRLGLLMNLNVSNNVNLTGQIPSELGLIGWLSTLSLSGTGLSGTVPEEICLLKSTARLSEITVNCSAVTCTCNCTCG